MDLLKKKKAQGMSLNIIIIAAIGLLVLVILAVIFIGRIGSTTRSVDACKGKCVPTVEECVGDYSKVTNDKCFGGEDGKSVTGEFCCVTV